MPRLPVSAAAALVIAIVAPVARADMPPPPRNPGCSVELLEGTGAECLVVVPGFSPDPELWTDRGFERRCSPYLDSRPEDRRESVWCRAPLATSSAGARAGEPAGATSPPPAQSGDAARPPGPAGVARLAAGAARLAHELGPIVRAGSGPGRNVALAPIALWSALATLSAGARGATESALRRGLGLEGPAGDAVTGARALAEDLRRRGVALTLSSAVLVDDARAVNPEFAAAARAAGAQVEAADFRRFPGDTRLRLDRWIARETGGRVSRLVPPRTLYRNTRVAVASAVGLVAHLPDTFVAGAAAPFYLGTRLPRPRTWFRDGERLPVAYKSVATRRASGTFPAASMGGVFSSGSGAIVVDVPLAGGIAMTLVLPHAMYETAPSVEAAALPKLLEGLRPQALELTIPDLPVDVPPLSLGDALSGIGPGNPFRGAFDARAGDLSGIAADAAGAEPLAGAELFHHVRFELRGGQGTPATPARAAGGGAPEVRLDHPFLFFVRDVASGAIVVSGAVNDPAPAQEEAVARLAPRSLGPVARVLRDARVTLDATVVRGGLRREEVRLAMERRAQDVAWCWGQQLVLAPRLGGTLTLRWAVDADGQVGDVTVDAPGSRTAASDLRACLAELLRSVPFDASRPGTAEQSWTLRPPRRPPRDGQALAPARLARRYARQPGERCREAGAQEGLGRGGDRALDRPQPRSADLEIDGSLDRSKVREVIARHDGEIRAAYERRLAQDPRLQGTVAIEWLLDGRGRAWDLRVDCGATTLDDSFLFEAMKARIEGWTFPKPVRGDTAIVNHRWTFVPVPLGRR